MINASVVTAAATRARASAITCPATPRPFETLAASSALPVPSGRYVVYTVPNDFMEPWFKVDDLLEIDTGIKTAVRDGCYLLDYGPGQQPGLRWVQHMVGKPGMVAINTCKVREGEVVPAATLCIIGLAMRHARIRSLKY